MSNYEKLAEDYAKQHCSHEDSSVEYLLNEKIEAAFIAGCLSDTKWIPIEEQKPEANSWVLITIKGYDRVTIGLFNGNEFTWVQAVAPIGDWDYISNVTHWMPLPQKP